MDVERIPGRACGPPFPVYEHLLDSLAAAHAGGAVERDATVAHVLATCAGYAYADTETFAMIVSRLGLGAEACGRVSQTVDAMFVCSTAYLAQSRCGRVVVLGYRGTEPQNLGNWLGDADVGSESSILSVREGVHPPRVHAGFYLNVRATWWGVMEELTRALHGRSLLDPTRTVEGPLQSLYVTGHSLGGALVIITSADWDSDVGSYSIRPAGLTSPNYSITFQPGTLHITPAALTITAEDTATPPGNVSTVTL